MTVAAYHLPPVALAILRRFSSAAALCADKPASWAMTGRMRSASLRKIRCCCSPSSTVFVIGRRLVGMSLLHIGDIAGGRAHHDRAIALLDPAEHRWAKSLHSCMR